MPLLQSNYMHPFVSIGIGSALTDLSGMALHTSSVLVGKNKRYYRQ